MAYLTQGEISAHVSDVRADFERLLQHRLFAVKPDARQWRFFRHCFDGLMNNRNDDYPCNKAKAAGYKFEIARTLKRYYSRARKSVWQYIFSLHHVNHLRHFITHNPDYPVSNGYVLLVSPIRRGVFSSEELHNILVRTVDDAIHAEFDAYRRLPMKDLEGLKQVFDAKGPAFEQICETIERRHRNNEVISNPKNPSTRILKSLQIVSIEDAVATVRTVEYWYVEWWSLSHLAYAPDIYRGSNRQVYTLIKRDDRWFVWANRYRPPRER